MNKRVLVIWNGNAGSAGLAADLRCDLEARSGFTVVQAGSYAEGRELASREAFAADLVVAAGGDGTVNAVINGLMTRSSPPPLAVLPLGTGNNLCRALDIPLDPFEAAQRIETGKMRSIDLVEAAADEGRTFFANVASGGNSDRVLEHLTDSVKKTWGPWCYLRSAVPVIADLKGYELILQLDDRLPEKYGMWNVIVANTHLAGGGLPVAPRARIDDDLLDVIVVLDGTPLDTTRLTAEFFLGDYLEDERVIYRTARRVRIESTPEIGFLADGEAIRGQPYTFVVHPGALRVVVGDRSAG